MHNRPSFILIFPCFFISSICDFVIRICLTSTILFPIFTDCVPLLDPTIGFLIVFVVVDGVVDAEGPVPDAGLFVGNLVVTADFFGGALTAGLMVVAITAEENHTQMKELEQRTISLNLKLPCGEVLVERVETIFFAAVSSMAASTTGDFFVAQWVNVCCDVFFSPEGAVVFFSVDVEAFFSMAVPAAATFAVTVVDLVLGDCFVGNTVGFSIAVHFRSDGLIGEFDSVLTALAFPALIVIASATFCRVRKYKK